MYYVEKHLNVYLDLNILSCHSMNVLSVSKFSLIFVVVLVIVFIFFWCVFNSSFLWGVGVFCF